MSDGIYAALSGAIAQQRALDVVANNIANVNTPGYRADSVAFREAVSREQGAAPDGLRYVSVGRMRTDTTSGPLTDTGNPLDIALQGEGMLAVRTPNGVRYTRAGSLVMDAEGHVRTRAGHAVLTWSSEQPELVVPAQTASLAIDAQGNVSADGQPIARLRIEEFADGTLAKEGLTLFVPQSGARGAEAQQTSVYQGQLEGANVSPIAGMNDLISANRAFEAFQRVIQAFRQIDERAARDVASTG